MSQNPRQHKRDKLPPDGEAASNPIETSVETSNSATVANEGGDGTVVSPLDVLLGVMRQKWRKGDHEGAVALAKAAAPYVHTKAGGARDGSAAPIEGLSDAELIQLATGGGGIGDAPEDTKVIDGVG